jgi:hypothetical protein
MLPSIPGSQPPPVAVTLESATACGGFNPNAGTTVSPTGDAAGKVSTLSHSWQADTW